MVGHKFSLEGLLYKWIWLNEISRSSLVVAPHLSRRGPNGLWIISRGVNHTIEKAFRERTLYYLEMGKRPWSVQEIDGWRRIHSLGLFRSGKHADKVVTKESGPN